MTALLLSGGMDSIAILYWKRPEVALTIDYGQNSAQAEIRSASYVCEQLGIAHHIISVDCTQFGSGDMSKQKPLSLAPFSDWWPFRNQMLLTVAAMYLINHNITTIQIGSVKPDDQFQDGTDQFTKMISDLISFQEGNMTVEAPAINMTTLELIEESKVPLSLLLSAHSCHSGNIACGSCRGCRKYHSVVDQLDLV